MKAPKGKFKVKLTLSYDGSEFFGWQKQKKTPQTVQQTLEQGLSKLLDEPIQVVGAGRTDAGVHAFNQVAHFWTQKDPRKFIWPICINGPFFTPESLVVKKAELVPFNFHATGSSLYKTYHYYILNRRLPSAFRRHYMTSIYQPLDENYLNQVGQYIQGTHDFKSFQTSGTTVPHTIRTLHRAYWRRVKEDVLRFEITGDGFLRQMVRNLVGTQIYMAQNQWEPEKILQILKAKDRQKAKGTAPPQGLYLYSVKYPSELDKKCSKI